MKSSDSDILVFKVNQRTNKGLIHECLSCLSRKNLDDLEVLIFFNFLAISNSLYEQIFNFYLPTYLFFIFLPNYSEISKLFFKFTIKRYGIIFKAIKMQALQFPRGNIYQIICCDGNQALSLQSKDAKGFKGSRIASSAPNANDIYQLWMVEKVGQGEDEFEIVNCASSLVWDEESGEIRTKPGKQSGDQLFKVQKNQNNAFWFMTSAKATEAVALEGILRHKQFDNNAINQLFYIVPVNNSTALNDSCILVNNSSGKAVDVPGSTFQHGERLIQFGKNRRFNQRWRWVQAGKGYLLQSLLNGQCLDIAEEKTASGSKVVQWDKTGNSNQQWLLVPAGQGVWKIKSVHAGGMFLSIKDDDVNDGGKLQISDADSPTQYWRIEGFVPK